MPGFRGPAQRLLGRRIEQGNPRIDSGLAPPDLTFDDRRVQQHGKKEMTAADWGRGLHAVPTGFDGTR